MLLFEQMIALFLIMGVGFLCAKKDIITDEVSKKLSSIVIFIANPALILSSGMTDEAKKGGELITMTILAVVIYAVLILLAIVIPIVLRVDKKSRGAYQVMTVFSNIVFMGYPLISSVYGNSAILYATMFPIFFNILIYTYGITVMKMCGDDEGEKQNSARIDPKRILNVGVIACAVSLVIYLTGMPVPSFISKTVSMLGSITAPVSMMIIGVSLAAIDIKKLFSDVKLLLFCIIRLVAVPLAGMLLIRIFIDNTVILGVCMVMLATPVASMASMLAEQYDGDKETTVKGVALSTLLSVATMPLVQFISGLG